MLHFPDVKIAEDTQTPQRWGLLKEISRAEPPGNPPGALFKDLDILQQARSRHTGGLGEEVLEMGAVDLGVKDQTHLAEKRLDQLPKGTSHWQGPG